jgi:hypothetical protein
MTQEIKIPPMIAQMVALCYNNLEAAREYARSIASDPDCPRRVQVDFLDVAASLASPIGRIEKRIPKSKWQDFSLQIREADALILDNIKAHFSRMTPKERELLELCAEGIRKGEIQIESV